MLVERIRIRIRIRILETDGSGSETLLTGDLLSVNCHGEKNSGRSHLDFFARSISPLLPVILQLLRVPASNIFT